MRFILPVAKLFSANSTHTKHQQNNKCNNRKKMQDQLVHQIEIPKKLFVTEGNNGPRKHEEEIS